MKNDLYSLKHLFELFAKNKMDSLFPGEWESIVKGHDLDLHTLREYQPGDPYNKVDWKQTAKEIAKGSGKIITKENLARSYASVMLLYDISRSVAFGEKEDLQAVIAVSLAYSALRGNNSCGMIMFSDKANNYIHPAGGHAQLQYIVNALKEERPRKCKDTSITAALQDLLVRVPRSLSFIISDFNANPDFKDVISSINKSRHDIISLIVVSQSELELPPGDCIIELTDQEKGGSFELDTSKYAELYHKEMLAEKQGIKKMLEARSCDAEIITTNDLFTKKISALLRRRKEKIR